MRRCGCCSAASSRMPKQTAPCASPTSCSLHHSGATCSADEKSGASQTRTQRIRRIQRLMERLQKILSQAGIASRRASEQLMLDGRVTVNGAAVRELGTKADPSHDDIRVDGRRVKVVERHRYLLLNKPRGYVTTRSDPEQRPTVMDLLRGVTEYVYPVGRLDFESEGLLILTNIGDLAAQLTHPRHGVARIYEARVLGVPDARDLERLGRGVVIDGRRTEATEVKLLPHG